jgi:hypothetical protein
MRFRPACAMQAGSVVASRLAVIALLLSATLGCHAAHPRLSPGMSSRLDDIDAQRLRRLDQATTRLGVAGLEVTLSRRNGFGAWAWPRGPIHVSRDLVDLLDDDELAAVIAHEMGHLREGTQWSGPLASLDGDVDLEIESRADVLGCQLLAARGIEPMAALRVLDKLDLVFASPDQPFPFAARTARARATCSALSG